MAEYYLISQLPSLDGIGENTPLPITEERFTQLCSHLLKENKYEELKKITLLPPVNYEVSCSELINAWNKSESDLRLALGKVRAERMKKTFDIENRTLNTEILKTANQAIEAENPLEAEKYLNRYRLDVLENLRPMDSFSEDYLFYYGLKLKLLLRIRQFNTELGEAAYKNIYNSILNGDRLEVEQ